MHRPSWPLVLALLTTACGTATDVSEPPASVSVTGVSKLEVTGEPLPAGRYTNPRFAPAISLELNGDWQAVQDAAGFFDVVGGSVAEWQAALDAAEPVLESIEISP